VKLDVRQAFAFLQRMSARERMLLGAAGAAMVAIGLYVLVWEPLASGREQLERRIALKEKELVQVQQLREEYLELVRQLEASQAVLNKSDEKFSLFPFIESTVAKVVGRERIVSMNPQNKTLSENYREDSVELKLKEVSLEQLVDMMYQIEKGPHPLRVTRLQVKKRIRDEQHFDVTATVSMLKSTSA
jgi:type II secretory pathway component PulM